MVLAVVATGIGILAGCSRGPTFPDGDVIAGPEGEFVFEPAELSIPVGETVRWGFGSSGHNVCCRPNDSDAVELPAEAESFASYGPEESPGNIVSQGEAYEHTFEVKGTYVYVCIPHVSRGMIGKIHVK